MSIIRMRTAAAARAVAATGAATIATTAAAAPAPAVTTMSFTEHGISDRMFSLGSAHGIAVGYIELVANELMQGGKQVGHDGQSYTVTRLGNGSADGLVSAAEVLTHGQLDLSGLVTSTPTGPGTFQLAVTGGTGTYQGAPGYAIIVPAPPRSSPSTSPGDRNTTRAVAGRTGPGRAR